MNSEDLSLLKDEELIQRYREDGSFIYFNILYKRYHSKVLNKCYSFVKDKETSRELTEDIFSKMYEKLPTFKQLSSFSSWLYSITYNHCIDFLRKKKKMHYPNWSRDHEIPEIIDETDENIERINYDNLLIILEMIHPEEKALLMMKYKDNLTMKQISDALRISEDAAKMRLKRARTRVMYLYTDKFLRD